MKNKKTMIGILCASALIVIISLIWWNVPCTITNISPSEVSKIQVLDGNTGKAISISNASDIKHIIENLNSISLRKSKLSLGYMGYSLKTTIYKINGDVYNEFIINSASTIRKDQFFYLDSKESIDYKYIKDLFQSSSK